MNKTSDELKEILRQEIAEAESHNKWCKSKKLASPFVSGVLNGRHGYNMTDKIAAALGYQRIERIWEPRNEQSNDHNDPQ